MKTKLLIIFLFMPILAQANLTEYMKVCEEIGFKPKTEDFGNCVLKLEKKFKNELQSSPSSDLKKDSGMKKKAKVSTECKQARRIASNCVNRCLTKGIKSFSECGLSCNYETATAIGTCAR